MTYLAFLLILGAALGAFIMSALQSLISARSGSDHPTHTFLRRAIRENGRRLFVKIPGLLNDVYCGALPLYTHWMLSWFPMSVIGSLERYLNPTINFIHVIFVACIAYVSARSLDILDNYQIIWASIFFALTPQAFHALSARNFGLSARGIGLVLFSAYFFSSYQSGISDAKFFWWIIATVISWLIWGFSTFALQAVTLISLLLLIVNHIWRPAAGILLGGTLFLLMNPRYGISYIKYTMKFIRAYSVELASIYILRRRYSIWRDLAWDIWVKFKTADVRGSLMYAYENSFLIILLLNPLSMAALLFFALGETVPAGWYSYAHAISLAGLMVAFLTSFRLTRFLGEPERYVEATTPWAILVAVYVFSNHLSFTEMFAVALILLSLIIAQLVLSHLLMRHVRPRNDELGHAAEVIKSRFTGEVRFCCNNEQQTKFMMVHHWKFAIFISAGQQYAGMNAIEAFSVFPFLRPEACERVVNYYNVNCLLIDRSVDGYQSDLNFNKTKSYEIIYHSNRFALYKVADSI
jgi:hypothetical protein